MIMHTDTELACPILAIIALINNVSLVINMAINYTVISFTPLHDHRMDFH